MRVLRRPFLILLIALQFLMIGMIFAPAKASAAEEAYCAQYVPSGTGTFVFGFPTWYKYLNPRPVADGCELDPLRNAAGDLDTNYLVKVGLAFFEILMRIAGMVSLAFVMYGAFQFLTSQGEPDKYAAARTTVVNALIGLTIAVSAVAIVNLIGGNVR
jgi:hypothetical protein